MRSITQKKPFPFRIKMLIGSVIIVLISSMLIFVLPPLQSPFSYTTTRLLHILGAILLLGNTLTGAFWMIFTDIQKSSSLFRFSIRAINLADIVFTTPGALLLLWNGFFLAHQNWGGLWQMSWLKLVVILFMILGLIWALILVPMQIHFDRLSEDLGTFHEIYQNHQFRHWLIKYFIFGSSAAAITIAILTLMVLKPNF